MHISIPKDAQCEFINLETTSNPMISKCQIKVCYVSDEPNRNNTVITKEVARNELASSLRGCPIVGFYNKSNEDFEEHNKTIKISNGEFTITENTKPYGFVDINARVWFQKFIDDNRDEREYLMTEGYIWTGTYPESQRIITHGNNQSMELDGASMEGQWTRDMNGEPCFFVINKAIITKLCVLGEDFEPCFEGAQIKASFSLDEGFQATLFSMVDEVKQLFIKGGTPMDSDKNTEIVEDYVEHTEESTEEPVPTVEHSVDEPDSEPAAAEEFAAAAEDKEKDEPREEKEEPAEEPEEKKKEYSLEEIPEYAELLDKYSALEANFSSLENEVKELRTFKLAAEKSQKEAMIDQFYMLSDEDKADVRANIDSYSLDEIESKLSVICVRNKVDFSLGAENDSQNSEILSYNFVNDNADDTVPEWIKAVRETEKNL